MQQPQNLTETPIDPSLMAYIQIAIKNKGYTAQEILQTHTKTRTDLEGLFYSLIEESERNQQFFSFASKDYKLSSYVNAVGKFIFKELKTMQGQMSLKKAEYYTNAARLINELLYYIKINTDNEAALKFNTVEFKRNVEHESSQDPEVLKLFNQICMLDIFGNFNLYSEAPDIPTMVHYIEDFSKFSKEQIEYCPPTDFDIYLEQFLISMNYSQTISNLAKQFIQDFKNQEIKFVKVSANEIYKLSREVLDAVGMPSNSLSSILLQSSIYRFFFNQIASNFDIFQVNIDSYEVFSDKCSKIKKFTARELNCSENHIPKGYHDTPIEQLVQSFQEYKDIIQLIESTQFLTNPFDILWTLNSSFKILESIGERSYKENTNKPGNTDSTLAFDDFFSIFWPIIAASPNPTLYIFSEVMDKIKGIDLINFSFPMTLIGSTIHYINEFDKTK